MGHEHFMLKEIYEQKEVIHATVDFLRQISSSVWEYMGITQEQAKSLEALHFDRLWNIMACCMHRQVLF